MYSPYSSQNQRYAKKCSFIFRGFIVPAANSGASAIFKHRKSNLSRRKGKCYGHAAANGRTAAQTDGDRRCLCDVARLRILCEMKFIILIISRSSSSSSSSSSPSQKSSEKDKQISELQQQLRDNTMQLEQEQVKAQNATSNEMLRLESIKMGYEKRIEDIKAEVHRVVCPMHIFLS